MLSELSPIALDTIDTDSLDDSAIDGMTDSFRYYLVIFFLSVHFDTYRLKCILKLNRITMYVLRDMYQVLHFKIF